MSAAERRPLFLSPHYDDAALSCGGTISAMADTGERPVILTVFGGEPPGELSPFARKMHRDWGLSPSEAIAHRRQEDTEAAALLGADAHWLDLPDAIYRGQRYLSDADLFGVVHPEEAYLFRTIREAILQFLNQFSIDPSPFYCPLGIGNHVDHQLVLATARTFTYRGYTVLAWEDFPYAGEPGVDPLAIASIRSANEPVIAQLEERHLARRIQAIDCYASQIDVIFRNQGGDPDSATRVYAELAGGGSPAERFWPL